MEVICLVRYLYEFLTELNILFQIVKYIKNLRINNYLFILFKLYNKIVL